MKIIKSKNDFAKGYRTVLLVENDKMSMKKHKNMLSDLGYNVLESKTGEEAIGISTTYGKDIDVTILDIVASDTDGKDIYSNLINARPRMKMLISSHYENDFRAKEIMKTGAHGLIHKPFTFSTLMEKLKNVYETD